jgi:hypothetical protein
MSEKEQPQMLRMESISNGIIQTGFSCHPVRGDSHLEANCGPTADGKRHQPPQVEFWCASGWYSTTEARTFAKAIMEICDKADSLWEQVKDRARDTP